MQMRPIRDTDGLAPLVWASVIGLVGFGLAHGAFLALAWSKSPVAFVADPCAWPVIFLLSALLSGRALRTVADGSANIAMIWLATPALYAGAWLAYQFMRLSHRSAEAQAGAVVSVVVWVIIVGVSLPLVRLGLRIGQPPVYDDDVPHCCECGYNLTGNVSGACPECGTPVGTDTNADAETRDDSAT